MPDPLIAAETFTTEYDGETVTINQGEWFDGEYDLIRKHRQRFVTELSGPISAAGRSPEAR